VSDQPDLPADPSGPTGDATGPAGPSARTGSDRPGSETERLRRRAQFLRDLAEARALRDRVRPRPTKAARLRQVLRMHTFRW
jgi:hypothetical protein